MARAILWINVLVALLFAALPHWHPVQNYLDLADPASAFGWLVTMGSILYLLTSTVLLMMAESGRKAVVGLRGDVSRFLNAPTVEPLRDDQFYQTFLESVRKAQSHVLISYFGPRHPATSQRTERQRYYRDLLREMQHRPRVQFRRLVRDTPSNREWVFGRLTEWTDLANVSVSLINDLPHRFDMPLALSVQVVDSKETWIVAVEGHERTAAYRDLYIRSDSTAEFLMKYFNRLWVHATLIVDQGDLTAAGGEFQREMEGR